VVLSGHSVHALPDQKQTPRHPWQPARVVFFEQGEHSTGRYLQLLLSHHIAGRLFRGGQPHFVQFGTGAPKESVQ
jgi:hypothetical protein